MVNTAVSYGSEGREYKRLSEEASRGGRSTQQRPSAVKRARVAPEPSGKNSTAKSRSGGRDGVSDGPGNLQMSPYLNIDLGERRVNQLFRFLRNVATGEISPQDAASVLRKKAGGLATNSTLSFRILDCVAFLIDFPSYKSSMEAFLSALERFGVVTTREIVAVIDANRLDDCGYSKGLTTIAIRERTRKQFVLLSYGLWRECAVGFDLLYQVMYGQGWRPCDVGEMSRLRDCIKAVAGQYALCPVRVLYELVTWCSLHDGDAIALLLGPYPFRRTLEVIRLFLSRHHSMKKEYQVSKRQYWRVPDVLGRYFFKLCARLLVDGTMELDDIYKYLDLPDAQLTALGKHFSDASRKANLKLERSVPPATCLIPIANCSAGDTTLRQTIRVLKKGNLSRTHILDYTTVSNARDMINARHAKLVEQLRNIEKNRASTHLSKENVSGNLHSESQRPQSARSNKGDVGSAGSQHDAASMSKSPRNNQYSDLVDLVKYDFLKDDTYAYIKDHIFALECDKLTLLSQLIDITTDLDSAAWKVTIQLFRHLQLSVKFPIMLQGRVSRALCDLLLRIITKHLSESGLDLCLSDIDDILKMLGPGLYLDLVCFSKTIKVLDLCLHEYTDRVCKLIWLYILPSMALVVEGNSQVNARLWHVLSRLPASKRYWIYHMYVSKVLNADVSVENAWIYLVKAAHNGAMRRTRAIFKRVTSTLLKNTKSASVRSSVSTVSGLASVDPFAVSHTIITQCEMFESLLLPLSEVGKYFGHLACDVFFFKLCSSQNQVCFNSNSECDEIGLSKRLSVNAQLSARFFRRHANSDLGPLLLGVLTAFMRSMMKTSLAIAISTQDQTENELPKEDTPEKSIDLKPIKMASTWSYPDDVSPGWHVVEYVCKLMELAGGVPQLAEAHALTVDQLNAQAGGVILRGEIMTQEADDETCGTTSREALAKVLLRPLFCHGLLLLSGKMRLEVLYDSEFQGNVKSLCATVDRLQKVALQLVEFKENTDVILGRNEDSPATSKTSLDLPQIAEVRRFWEEATAMYLINSSHHISSDHYAEGITSGPFQPEFLKFIATIHLPDIWVPTEQYQKTLQRLDDWIKDVGSGHSSGSHRRLKKLRARYQALEREMKQQIDHVASMKEKLVDVLAKGWLKPDAQPGPKITMGFLNQCIAPRVFVNEAEAYFCGRIVDIMLAQRVEYFNFFDFYNCWTKMLMSMVRCCTEREAPLLAIFVNHTFSVIRHWSSRAKEFEEMTQGHPCYCATFKYVPNKELTHPQLLSGIRKWEGRILRALSYALELHISDPDPNSNKTDSYVTTPTWIDQKSAVVFLARCHENFPITSVHGKRLLTGLQCVKDNAQKHGWKDVHIAASTLVKTFEKYDRENRWL